MDVASTSTKPSPFSRFKSFVPKKEGKLKTVAAGAFVLGLDLRVPTTTQHMSEVQKNEILSTIQPGDICLETNDAYPEWQRLEYLTTQSNHTHAFTYEGNGKMLQST